MKYAYIKKRFSQSSLDLIEKANRIIDDYKAQGYRLTLRQLYYQMVASDLIPNNIKSYKRLASVINDARWAGYVDWDAIEDRGRNTVRAATWASPYSIMQSVIHSYRENLWIEQPYHVEVMCEKDAVSNILEPVCRELGVPFTANRGYPSASLLYEVSRRFHIAEDQGKEIAVIYLGDHDPSGLDMDRDISERLNLLGQDLMYVDLSRLALTMDQVNLWNPPPNPAKQTDSRFAGYVAEYGDESWELDAIKPRDLERILRRAIDGFIYQDAWNEAQDQEDEHKQQLIDLTNKLED